MATILRASESSHGPHIAAFNFDDLAVQAADCLERARAEAAEIVTKAKGEADGIRREAAEEGCKAAMREFDRMTAAHVAPAIAAMRESAAELHRAKQEWVSHWETGVVQLATAIASRVIRREVREQPDITLTLVREALDLAAGSPNIRLHLNPEDYQSLGVQVRTLVDAMSSASDAEVLPDAAVSRGSCRVETRFGTIDQQIESQLQRIEEELAA